MSPLPLFQSSLSSQTSKIC
uniref:Uncharacterized protein n=1 Tax=Rhizophora mucronata TaxID=61149 RepID=A0A2P2R4K6_RHIMU